MTDIEQQLRAYAAAIDASQDPVALPEVTGQRPHHRGWRRIPVAIAVALVLVCGTVAAVVVRDSSGSQRLRPSALRGSSGGRSAASCPAASLVVTSTSSERLHPNWLPSGFVLTSGNETDLGQTGFLTYSTPRHGDRPYVEILREHSNLPLTKLYRGTSTPTVVQGHPAILSVDIIPLWAALVWRPEPGVALVVDGYKLPRADLYKIATDLQYNPGSTFRYPSQVHVSVTRQQALTELPGPPNNKHVALTSFGELNTLARFNAQDGRPPTMGAGASLTRPVWIAWTTPYRSTALVVDAQTAQVTTVRISRQAVESLTDRSESSCAPPYGVLTRSEAAYIQPPDQRPLRGASQIIKLSTLGTIASHAPDDSDCGGPTSCDPTVPVWIYIQTARDQRFTQTYMSPAASRTYKKRGSFSITMMDARTGPQDTNFGFESGPGPAPASVLAIPDLEPETARSSANHGAKA